MNSATVPVIILYGNREARIIADDLCFCGICSHCDCSVRFVHYFSTAAGLRRLEKNLLHCQFVCSKSNVPCPETEPHPRTYFSDGTYQEVSEEHLIGRDLWFECGWSWLHRFYSLSWSTGEVSCLLVILTNLCSFFAPFLNLLAPELFF